MPTAIHHLRWVHVGSQESLGCAVGQGQVLHQETPKFSWVPGHRVQRKGGHWTGKRIGLNDQLHLELRCTRWAQSQAPQHHGMITAAGSWPRPAWTS
jgi:hypothetical protein